MPQDPFPSPQGDAEEPDSSLLPSADGGEGPDDGGADGEGPAEQGLYVCVPAEHVTLAGFAQGGEADTMTPGPLLATVVHTVAGEDGKGLSGCSDDQLMGIISAGLRLESRNAWTVMAAMAEYAARYPGTSIEDEFAADELACELHLTPLSAAEQMRYSSTVVTRLPQTFAALGAGRVHPVHVRIIEDETSVLSDEDAAKADRILADAAPGLTFGKLRSAAHKLILQLDPEAAKKRKEAARGQTHVRVFRETSGNAGMVAHELPSDEALASMQHVEQRALDLRAAGMPGSLRELRVRACLDLLQERDSRDLLATPVTPADSREADDAAPSGSEEADQASKPDQPAPDSDPPGSADTPDTGHGSGGPGGPGRNGGGSRRPDPGPAPTSGPSIAALVNITIPWATQQGRSETPGEADGFGSLDGDDTRDLAAAAARHPLTRWCVTALNPDGTAAAHACLPGRHPPPALNITMIPVARGPCDHAHGEVGYHPSRKLTHIIRARSRTCTAPGCARPAARCDLDHTHAWDQGGRTCECNLAPLCRHHHRCKQAEGWQLEQPEPGVLVWRTPSGRRYTTTPAKYAI
jgi:Domain of unknown function (DUF222)